MANQLDELEPIIKEEGLDTNVIAKKIPVEKDISVTVMIGVLYLLGVALLIVGIVSRVYLLAIIGLIIPVFVFSKLKKIESYFSQLEQRIQQSSSQIDNYMEQRVVVLQNTVKLVERAIDVDKSTFKEIAGLRSGRLPDDNSRNEVQSKLDMTSHDINIAVESYPELKSHTEIRDAMQQNVYLQREITAAREVYNDNVGVWNREIFTWPFKKYVAAKKQYTTRIPFIASQEMKQKSKQVFF